MTRMFGLCLSYNITVILFYHLKAMMVDEADEFVTGTQGKGKRPIDSSTSTGAPKRRRCMSPLLRLGRAYTPPNKTPPRCERMSTNTHLILMFEMISCSTIFMFIPIFFHNHFQLQMPIMWATSKWSELQCTTTWAFSIWNGSMIPTV